MTDPTKTEICEECGEACSGSEMYGDRKCEDCTELCTCCDENPCIFANDVPDGHPTSEEDR